MAGPESANNAGSQTSFIPLLTLGLPSNAIMALMMGAMMIQGIQPGSAVMTSRPDLFWGHGGERCGSATLMLVIHQPADAPHLGEAADAAVSLACIPAILMFCVIGVYVDQQQRDRRW